MTSIQRLVFLFLLGSVAFFAADAFAPKPLCTSGVAQGYSSGGLCKPSPSALQGAPIDLFETTSTTVAAATLDPTSFLTDLLGAFISSNLILAVPIVAAFGVAALIGFGIVAYANPAEPEDD